MNPQYFNIITPEDEEEFHRIRLRIRPLQSGAVIDSIKKAGAEPGRQIGASFPALKQLALKFRKSASVATMLWHEKRREEQIVALYLFPESLVPEQLPDILEEAVSREVSEYAGSQWLAERKDIENILYQFMDNASIKIMIPMICASARYAMQLEHGGKKIPETVRKWILRPYEDSYCEMVAERYRFKFNKG